MSNSTKEELQKFSNKLSWCCFGITRVPASVDGEEVSCHLIDERKSKAIFVGDTEGWVQSSTVGEELIPEPLIVRENI